MIYTLQVLSGDIWSLTGHLRSEHLNPHNSLSDFNNKNTASAGRYYPFHGLCLYCIFWSRRKYLLWVKLFPSILNISPRGGSGDKEIVIIFTKSCPHFMFWEFMYLHFPVLNLLFLSSLKQEASLEGLSGS